MAITEQEVFVLSEHALSDVIDQIRDNQWNETTPSWFQTGRQGNLSLHDIINYHAYDSAWVPDTLAGKTITEVGNTYDGDLLGTDPKRSYRHYSERAATAVQALTDLEKIVHLSYGDHPTREYLKHVTTFRGFRAYDIAKWIGANTTLPPDLVQGLWDEVIPDVEQWRQLGVFGPAVTVPEHAPLQDRLLGLVGRDPSH